MTPEQIARAVFPIGAQTLERLRGLIDAVDRVVKDRVAGCFVECGIYRGVSPIAVRLRAPEMACWLYDTFTGMTEPGEVDVSSKGKVALEKYQRLTGIWMAATQKQVVKNMQSFGVYDPRSVLMFPGDVHDTLVNPNNLPERISVLRLDTDWYASTKLELEVLWPRLSLGGVLIVDDYGYWKGARLAVDEFFGDGRLPAHRMYDSTALEIVKMDH